MTRPRRRGHPAHRFRLSRSRQWMVYGVGGSLWASGALWLVAHFFWRAEGEMGMIVHPAEPWSLRVHGAAVLLMALAVGVLWPVHIQPAWRSRVNRGSGLVMGLSLLFLTVTGYLLYYGSGDALREWVVLWHWVVGLAVPVLVGLHVVLGRRTRVVPPMAASDKP